MEPFGKLRVRTKRKFFMLSLSKHENSRGHQWNIS